MLVYSLIVLTISIYVHVLLSTFLTMFINFNAFPSSAYSTSTPPHFYTLCEKGVLVGIFKSQTEYEYLNHKLSWVSLWTTELKAQYSRNQFVLNNGWWCGIYEKRILKIFTCTKPEKLKVFIVFFQNMW